MDKKIKKETRDFCDLIAEILSRSRDVNDFARLQEIKNSRTQKEKVALKIFNYTNQINSLLDDLSKVEIFIRRFPLKDYYERNEIDILKYIKYHYEVLIHKVHTILDVMKLILNKVYSIGLTEAECNWHQLQKHTIIRQSDLTKVISSYHDEFKDIIQHRHLNTHRAIFLDETNSELSLQNFFYLREKYSGEILDDDFKNILPKCLIEYRISSYRKQILMQVKDISNKAHQFNDEFSMLLFTEFHKQNY